MTQNQTEAFIRPTLTVKIRDNTPQQDTFEFAVPTMHDEIRIGARIQKIHQQIDPDWNGFDQGLDGMTLFNLRACATFELLLKKSSAKWPWVETSEGIKCLSANFPAERVNDVLLAYQGLLDSIASFREKGTVDSQSAGPETVDRS